MKRATALFIFVAAFTFGAGIINAGAEGFGGDGTEFIVSTPQPTPKVDYITENGIKFYCEDYEDGVRIRIKKVLTDNVVIPETVNGRTVLSVDISGPGAKVDTFQYESIHFPDTVEDISGLGYNKKLTSVHLPANLKEIGNFCSFCECTALESIEIPANVTKISCC